MPGAGAGGGDGRVLERHEADAVGLLSAARASALPGSSRRAFWRIARASAVRPCARACRPAVVNCFESGASLAPRTTPGSNNAPNVRSPTPFRNRAVRDISGVSKLEITGGETGSGARRVI